MPNITCTCGRQIEVQENQAGTPVQCPCGLELRVPNLRDLRAQANARGNAAHNTENGTIRETTDAASDAEEPAEQTEPDERHFLVFLTPPDKLPERISFDAASHFVAACDRLLQRFFADPAHQWNVDLQISMALVPEGPPIVEAETLPAIIPEQTVDELAKQLRSLACPPVVEGPVAFVIRRPVGDGPPCPVESSVAFRSLAQKPGDLEDNLLRAAGLIPPHSFVATQRDRIARRWSRFTQLVRRLARSNTTANKQTTDDPTTDLADADLVNDAAISAEDRDIIETLDSESIEQLTACLERHPHVTALHYQLASLLVSEDRFEEAIATYTELLQVEPDDAAAYASRGRLHCHIGSMQRGLADFTKALELNPHDSDTRVERAMLYLELEGWEIAEADLTAAIGLAPNQPRLYVERARTRYAQQKLRDGQADLQMTLHLDPYSVDAHMLSGWILQHLDDATLNDIIEATDHYTKAIEIDPHNPAYLVQRAEVYTSQNKLALAIGDCDQALSLDTNNAIAYGIRGYAHQQLDNLPAAVADCTRAIDLGLKSPAVYVSRAVGHAAADEFALALADCDTAIDIAPDYAIAYNYRGMLKMGQEDAESAILDFAEASRLAPTWSTPLEYRADAHRIQAEFEQAIDQYTDTIKLEPDNLAAYIGRALAWTEKREFDQAQSDLNKAIEIDDECAPAFLHRAELAMQREQFESALADLDRVIALDANSAAAYHARAQVYLHLKRGEDAIGDFNKLIELQPDWPGAYVGRANAWIRLGNAPEAAADYREAANLDPSSTEELIVHQLVVEAHHLHEQENYPAAIEKAAEAIERDQRNLAALATRAASYWYSDHFVEAAEDYSQLIELESEATFAYVGRGQVYVELGEYELALTDLDRAVESERQASSETGLAYALSGRGLARAGLQQFDDAQEDFEQSARLRPNNAWVHYNRGLVYRTLDELTRAAESFQHALESTDPPLPKRKRERAEAFLKQYPNDA